MGLLIGLGVFLVLLVLVLLFVAMILKVSCSFVDVRQPSWMKAVGIVVVSFMIQIMAIFLLVPFLKGSDRSFGDLIALLVGTGVAAAVYSAMLETEYWRGLVICIIQSIIFWILKWLFILFIIGILLSSDGSSRRRFNAGPSYEQPEQPEEPERPTSLEVKD